ncbi:hypothetical protein [Tranquillimonas rosea]|uniref:hypothetical protein n=1 Tax=Tranquillimonas rosea TaxID=641238 RepID=UPI003BABDD0D
MRSDLAALALLLTTTTAASAQEPLSAIDWLSDSVTTAAQPSQDDAPVSNGALPGKITVEPLDAPRPNDVGLFAPEAVGLPDALWSGAETGHLSELFAGLPVDALPSLRRMTKDLLSARAAPPPGDGASLFLSRVDALLRMGDIDRAGRLLERAGGTDPRLFRRAFDVALLNGSENRACARMRRAPEIAPTYAARVFCLARGGDWRAAALTLEAGDALGVIGSAEDRLLARFLDPAIADSTVSLPPPRDPTPLSFAMLAAIGEPMGTTGLPLAFAHFDLRPTAGWSHRIAAAERLARAGAIAPARLFEVYDDRQPPASGGTWDRVEAVQDAMRAISGSMPDAVNATLPDAWTEMQAAGLASVFARHLSPDLSNMPLDGAAQEAALEMALLTDDYAAAADSAGDALPRDVAIVLGRAPLPDDASPKVTALREGLAGEVAPPERLTRLVDEDRRGEALLLAAEDIDRGAAGDLDELAPSLAFLVQMGLDGTARRTALEILMLDRGA